MNIWSDEMIVDHPAHNLKLHLILQYLSVFKRMVIILKHKM